MVGSKPGERRGGRQKGTPNKVSAELRDAAQEYTDEALQTLANVMRNSKSDQARTAAANSLLDRGWGRAHQTSQVALSSARDIREWTNAELLALLNAETGGPPSTRNPNFDETTSEVGH